MFEVDIVRRLLSCLLLLTLVLSNIAAGVAPALAIESVRVPLSARAIDLTQAVEHYSAQGDRLQVSTAPGSDGIIRRIEVSAREAGTAPSWIVFALTNDTDEQVDRLIVAPHFRLVGSGVIWPDLGASRVSAITASQGSPPEREDRPTPTCSADARSRHHRHLRRRVAHAEPAAALSVGARRLQGQGHQPDALQGHDDRHCRPSRAVPHHRVRREGRGDLSRRRGARLGGAGLCLHRLRILAQDFRLWGRTRTASGAPAPKRSSAATLLVFLFAYLNLQPLARARFACRGRVARRSSPA